MFDREYMFSCHCWSKKPVRRQSYVITKTISRMLSTIRFIFNFHIVGSFGTSVQVQRELRLLAGEYRHDTL